MSRFDFKLPDIGEGVMEGEIVKWLVRPGDVVGEDEPVAEVMTDKATVTITSPKAGKIVELGGGEGEIIAVHSTLVVLDLGGGAAAPATASPQPAAKQPSAKPGPKPARSNGADDGPAATAVGDIREELPGMAAPRPRPTAPAHGYFNPKPLATPASRKLARDLGVDLRAVPPSGPHDRVSKDDIRRFADGAAAVETPRAPTAPSAGAQAPIAVKAPSSDQAALEVRTPLKGVRKRIFDAMARSKHTAAHFTFVEECDVTALKALRERLRPMAADQGVKLTYLPFFVKASVAALKKHPSLNGAFDESTQEIVERRYYNIGIASATEAGLMVPVVKNADRRSILDVAREIQRLGEATKNGKIAPDDLSGSTFTITSLGQQGGLFATPILNTPELAILGIHQMKQKPVVRDGKIVVGDVMLLSLSFDHRLIDGHVGAAFAYDLIALLETPDRLLLEMG
jgi:pyruvate dehydrogenase E2 component (dihydrolipoamide acetyltransferase)